MPISQKKSYFETPKYSFLDKPMLFDAITCVKAKTNSNLA